LSVSRPSALRDHGVRPEPLVPRSSSRPRVVFELREEEAAAVAEVGIVELELMPVIAQRQRLLEAAGQRLEPAEMLDPFARR
jgi:hypothetical protein